MKAKHVFIFAVAFVVVGLSIYMNFFKSEPVDENTMPVAVNADLLKRAEYISLELRKMADQRSLWKLERCSARGCQDFVEASADSMRQFSKNGWKVDKMTETKSEPGIYTCFVTNDDGQKGIMVLQSPDKGKHWGLIMFKLS